MGIARGERWKEAAAIGLFLVACALFLFLDGRTTPFVLWDESRNVVNALEMRRTGFSLITTYGFAPDQWNTKPPLLIWLMVGSMKLFGASEWAMRLPSAIAAIATLLILILFVRRVSGSLATAILAAALLLFSPGFFGESGARTADYDALLLFFTTFYLQRLFFLVHRSRPNAGGIVASGALVGGAVMTKSIAGLIPGAGVAVHLLVTGRWRRVLRGWLAYAAFALIALAPFILFCLARESVGPGYVGTMAHNDLLGRFHQSLIGKPTSPWVYVQEISGGWFSAGPALFVIVLGWRRLRGKARLVTLYSLCVAGTMLAIYTAASTRLIHYALPAFPWLAVATALSLRALAVDLVLRPLAERRPRARLAAGLAMLVALLLGAQATAEASFWRYQAFPTRQFYPRARYGDMFAEMRRQGLSQVTVIDGGSAFEGKSHYLPLLHAYQLLWAERGLSTRRLSSYTPDLRGRIVTCDPRLIRKLWPATRNAQGCVAFEGGRPL